jgi:hypothetical protein
VAAVRRKAVAPALITPVVSWTFRARRTRSAALGASEADVMDQTVQNPLGRRIHWENVTTVLSAAILIGAEVFGAAYAGGWAIAGLFQLGEYGVYALQILFFFLGVAVMIGFVRNAQRVEPFTYRD